MLQRIQTVYLFFAVFAFCLAFFFPIARYAAPIEQTHQTVKSELNLIPKTVASDGIDMAQGLSEYVYPTEKGFIKTWPLVTLIVLCMAIAAISIALFSNRVLQMRIVACGFMLGVVYIFLVFIWAVDAYGKAFSSIIGAAEPAVTWSIGTWAPVAGTILMFLAQRAIRSDEMKVRSADHLR
ncbi:MAG: DUF4293 domain-containing protein [Bacteroidales bacterium]|nr:DUF4293 domain-containing protein [Bacteroidales bacterium]